MKLVHLSDIHINADPIAGSDTVAEFAAALAHIQKRHADADAVVISGDLTHHGQHDSYVRLRAMLDELPAIERVVFVCFGDAAEQVYRRVLAEIRPA